MDDYAAAPAAGDRVWEERWRSLAHSMPGLVAATGADGKTEYFNDMWREYTGLPDEQLLRGGVQQLIHPDDLAANLETWTKAIAAGDRVTGELRLRRHDGTYRWHHGVLSPVREPDGTVAGWVGAWFDIDDRVRGEERIVSSEQRYRTLIDCMPAMIATTDAAGLVDYHSDGWLAYTGLTREQLRERWVEVVHPDDYVGLSAGWQRALATRQGMEMEYRVRRHDGTWCWHRSLTTPVFDDAGVLTMWIDACIDIDARKRMEDELRRANAAKDEFLGLVSHELRTPITVIQGNAEILRTRGDRLAPRDRNDALTDVEREAMRLNRIVANLLTLARLDDGQRLEGEPVLVRRLVQRLVDAARLQYPWRTIDLVTMGPPVPVVAEAGYVEQVLNNLISNADKYSPQEATVEVRVSTEAGAVAVTVADRGIGLSAEDAPRIFEPFYRATTSAATVQGVGIGLAVCKRLVEAQRGEMRVAPRAGGGTEFTFTLPLAPGAG